MKTMIFLLLGGLILIVWTIYAAAEALKARAKRQAASMDAINQV